MKMNLTVSLQINARPEAKNRFFPLPFMPLIALLAGMMLCLHSPAFGSDNIKHAEAHVAEMISTVKAKTEDRSLTKEETVSLFADIITEYFDLDGIVRYTAGRYWRIATDDERKAYKELFVAILTKSAAEQFGQLAQLDFTPTTSRARGDKLVLVGGIISDKSGKIPDAAVAWRVTTVAGKPAQIIDIEVENISMLKTQQDENTAIIRRNGGTFSALIKELEARQKSISGNASQ
jgi:phospholipid transport system substrate-binding protein